MFKADSGRAVFNQCPRQQTVCLIQSQPKTETKLVHFCILSELNDSNLKGVQEIYLAEEGERSEPEPEPVFDHYLSLSSTVSFAGRSAAIFCNLSIFPWLYHLKKPSPYTTKHLVKNNSSRACSMVLLIYSLLYSHFIKGTQCNARDSYASLTCHNLVPAPSISVWTFQLESFT